jgi:hypothetical protein
LIDRNHRSDVAEVTQIIGELSSLFRGLDISAKKHKPSGLDLPVERGIGGSQFGAGDAENEKLSVHEKASFRFPVESFKIQLGERCF